MSKKVAIIDFAMGNLFSIRNACSLAGLDASITSDAQKISAADAVILPGVGAFGRAMDRLNELKLVNVIKEAIEGGQPFMGICLGLQLLMSESEEFGQHKGLDIIKGKVIRLENDDKRQERRLKVPHVGWSQVYKNEVSAIAWESSVFNDVNENAFMYFVHSFYVQPDNENVILSRTQYGDIQFCSSIQYKNVFACQFHPERSGEKGLKMYQNFANLIDVYKKGSEDATRTADIH